MMSRSTNTGTSAAVSCSSIVLLMSLQIITIVSAFTPTITTTIMHISNVISMEPVLRSQVLFMSDTNANFNEDATFISNSYEMATGSRNEPSTIATKATMTTTASSTRTPSVFLLEPYNPSASLSVPPFTYTFPSLASLSVSPFTYAFPSSKVIPPRPSTQIPVQTNSNGISSSFVMNPNTASMLVTSSMEMTSPVSAIALQQPTEEKEQPLPMTTTIFEEILTPKAEKETLMETTYMATSAAAATVVAPEASAAALNTTDDTVVATTILGEDSIIGTNDETDIAISDTVVGLNEDRIVVDDLFEILEGESGDLVANSTVVATDSTSTKEEEEIVDMIGVTDVAVENEGQIIMEEAKLSIEPRNIDVVPADLPLSANATSILVSGGNMAIESEEALTILEVDESIVNVNSKDHTSTESDDDHSYIFIDVEEASVEANPSFLEERCIDNESIQTEAAELIIEDEEKRLARIDEQARTEELIRLAEHSRIEDLARIEEENLRRLQEASLLAKVEAAAKIGAEKRRREALERTRLARMEKQTQVDEERRIAELSRVENKNHQADEQDSFVVEGKQPKILLKPEQSNQPSNAPMINAVTNLNNDGATVQLPWAERRSMRDNSTSNPITIQKPNVDAAKELLERVRKEATYQFKELWW